jgi:hypothetical protein
MIRVIFRSIELDVQDYEWSEDDHVVSIIDFDLEENGLMNRGLSARIMQPRGAPCDTNRLEISNPTNYGGPLDPAAFREAVASYYREACRERAKGTWARSVEYELHPFP